TKSAVSIISKFRLSPLAFNWLRVQPEDRVSKKAQRSHREPQRDTMPHTASSTGYSLPAFACPLPPSLWRKQTIDCHRSAQSFPPPTVRLSRPPLTSECEYTRDSEPIAAPKHCHESPDHP